MQQLTEIALEKAIHGIFTRLEVACWIGGSPDRQFGILKRALKSGEVIRIHRGLYCLSNKCLQKYLQKKIHPLVVAQCIHGPSYISLEAALSWHEWIPEAVYAVTSVSLDRARQFDTPLGYFSFTRIPQSTLYTEVTRMERDGGSFFMASPLKALADYVYVHKRDWISAQPIIESLRVEEAMLDGIDSEVFHRLLDNYSSLRVRRFLEGLRKDLKR